MQTLFQKPDTDGAEAYFQAKIRHSTGPVEISHFLGGDDMASREFQMVDVRAREDYEKAHIPGAVNLPQENWEQFAGLSREKMNILYCYTQTCHLAAQAGALFASKGFPVMEMDGGFEAWKQNEFEIETSEGEEHL